MKRTSDDIATHLAAESGLALTYGTNLYCNIEPNAPPNLVVIYDGPGGGVKESITVGRFIQYPSIQIRVRDIYQDQGFAVAYDILNALDRLANIQIGSAYYLSIICATGPEVMNWDTENRIRIVQNYNIVRTKI